MKDPEFQAAKMQVRKKKNFYRHLGVYLSVGSFFLLMNLATYHGKWWFFFPLLPWGIGLAIQYLTTFGFPGTGILSDEWEQRELEQELNKRGYYRRSNALPPANASQEDDLDLGQPQKIREKRLDEEDFV